MLTLAIIVIVASAALIGSVFVVLNTLCNVLLTAPAVAGSDTPRLTASAGMPGGAAGGAYTV